MRRKAYCFALTLAISLLFTPAAAQAGNQTVRSHQEVNCNTIANRHGTDQRACIMVNRHDVWYWRAALADFCSGTNGADYVWVDRIWLERNGNTVESNSNRRWAPICGAGERDSISTDWDEYCAPGGSTWQAHVRLAFHWKSGGQTALKEIHSGVDHGFC